MTDTELPPVEAKPRRKRVNLALAGVLLAQGLDYPEIAPRVGSKSPGAVKAALWKKGITKQSCREPSPDHIATATVTAKVVHEADAILRERLNGALSASVDAIASKRPTYRGLASKGQGHASTLKQLAEIWRALNGSPDSITVAFGVGRDPGSLLAGPKAQPVANLPAPIVDVTPAGR